jgi:hypothetical protein
MKLRAIVTKPEFINRIVHSLGESTIPPSLAPALKSRPVEAP